MYNSSGIFVTSDTLWTIVRKTDQKPDFAPDAFFLGELGNSPEFRSLRPPFFVFLTQFKYFQLQFSKENISTSVGVKIKKSMYDVRFSMSPHLQVPVSIYLESHFQIIGVCTDQCDLPERFGKIDQLVICIAKDVTSRHRRNVTDTSGLYDYPYNSFL